MKILVPVKRVPDPYGRVRLTAEGLLDDSEIKWVINPFDEIALEEAVRIRENSGDVEIVAVTVGPDLCSEQLRTALAMGADRATHVVTDVVLDQAVTSQALAAICKKETPDIVLMGKQAIDDDASQTGQRLAALLVYPQASFASKVEIGSNKSEAVVTRETDSGRETIKVNLPAIITADLRLNEPRYVALPAIIRARSKQVTSTSLEELSVNAENAVAKVTVIKMEAPPTRKAGRTVGSVSELVTALREEAGVI